MNSLHENIEQDPLNNSNTLIFSPGIQNNLVPKMSQKYSNNFIDNILKKLKEADDLIIKKYELFISGKNSFFNSKIQILNDINKYFNDIKENFENEHKKNLNFINSYFNEIEK